MSIRIGEIVGSSVEVNIALGTSGAAAFDVTATAGAVVTRGLFGRHILGSSPDDCSGTLSVQFFGAVLP